ncbi:MAG: DUF5103 domain-containing protein, partial [Muribaculaceae bacterium]|nr:DUF5103 domain-containing protein [Muribaculaceae bacterium]
MSAILFGSAGSLRAADTSTKIFDSRFHTPTVILDDNLLADPVLILNNPESSISFSFDELGEDRSYLRARLVHCNADWQPSMLSETEYVEGFNQADIEDFGYSSNTFVHYVNYRFNIPAEGLRPLVSGNYLLQVYDSDHPDEILLQMRFRAAENVASINATADGRTDRSFNDNLQQLAVAVNTHGEVTYNPYSDLFLEITANSRPDTSRILRAPSRMQQKTIIYDHNPLLIFPAGNEYRRFETVRNDYPGMGIERTEWKDPMYHAWLKTATPRSDRQYLYDQTQHGRFKIDEYNSTDPDLGADYILTHFILEMDELHDADVYVEGDLTLRDYSAANRMKYLPEIGAYTLTLPLKQGSYNYQYVTLPKS